MNLMQLLLAVPAAFLILGNSVAIAGETVDIAGAIACVNDKWTETEPDKGHKLADLVQRCVIIPNDPAAAKYTQDCVGKYEYQTRAGRPPGPALTPTKVETRDTRPGRRVRTSRNTRSRLPVALANTKVPVAVARTCTRL
jgi:hypothetical protein